MSREHHTYQLADASLKVTANLPNGAATVNGTGIDLDVVDSQSAFLAGCEVKVDAPALTTALLPDTQTVTYKLEQADDSGFATNKETLVAALGVQTGAGGAGAAAQTLRFRLPTTVRRYVRLVIIKTGAANASAAEATVGLVF